MRGVECNDTNIARAAQLVRDGRVIVFPTDTVYGMGCDPYNETAVKRIYRIKNRDMTKPLPVLVRSIDVAERMAVMPDRAVNLAERFWPGPLTIVVHMRKDGPKFVSRNGKIAVRVPNGDCIGKLLKGCDCIVGSSANVSGQGSSNALQDVNVICDMALDGGTIPKVGESSIVDATHDDDIVLLRRGAISKEDISS